MQWPVSQEGVESELTTWLSRAIFSQHGELPIPHPVPASPAGTAARDRSVHGSGGMALPRRRRPSPLLTTEGVDVSERHAWRGLPSGQPAGRIAPWCRAVGRTRRVRCAQLQKGSSAPSFERSHVIQVLIEPVTGTVVDANPAAYALYGCAARTRSGACRQPISVSTRPRR